MAKAAQPPASRSRLMPILAAYQPCRRSSRPACLICRESWVYSLHRPLGADAGGAVDSWSRLIPAPASWVVAGARSLGTIRIPWPCQAARRGRRRPSSPPLTWAGRCCSPMRALRTSTAPVRAGITHCSTLSCRWALATSSGVSMLGSVPPSTGTSPAWFSLAPRARDQAVAARAAPVRAVLTTVAWPTPCWLATRPLLAASRIKPPATCAAMPARLTGVQRFQPEFATRSRCLGSSTSAAAPLSPTAPISEPPNQVASPRSCRERETVLSAVTVLLLRTWRSGAGTAGWPAAPLPLVSSGLSLVRTAELVLVAVDLDLLLAELLGHLALVGYGLGVEPDPLLGAGPFVDHDLLLTQGDLVLLLGDGGAAGGRVQVGVGDRLALDPDLLALDRHDDRLGLGGDVFA